MVVWNSMLMKELSFLYSFGSNMFVSYLLVFKIFDNSVSLILYKRRNLTFVPIAK
jgi:hypothetical protein